MKVNIKKSNLSQKLKPKLHGIKKKKSVNKSVKSVKQRSKKININKKISLKDDAEQEHNTENKSDIDEDESGSENEFPEGINHKKALENLKDTDPEFYKFLEENDKGLLDFSNSEEDSDEEDKIHKPPQPGELEVNSDEDDFQDDTGVRRKSDKNVTLKLISEWQMQLAEDKSLKSITTIIKGFHAALVSIMGVAEDDTPSEYIVEGSAVFNAVVQMCVMELQPALIKILKLPSESSAFAKCQPSKAKKWVKVKPVLKSYFNDLLKLLGGVSSDQIVCVMLKHVHQMIPFICYYEKIVKSLLKRLVSMWSKAEEETVRVLAFLCILRITTSHQRQWLEPALKKMYMAFISNSKFVSPTTLPGINFMRRSLTEILSIEPNVSYNHAFLYVRQLAIHLRNAITLHKKDCMQTVYNWQYVNSLHLWVDLLCTSYDKPQLQTLLYPLVQVIIGCIKLIPTAQYYPLRFHCCQMLINLMTETGVFIPVLPLVLEVLTITDFDKKHKKLSMKPMDLSCILRLSKAMLQENAFKDAAIEYVYKQLIECLSAESYRISFPDLAVLPTIQLKDFIKKCKTNKYGHKFRSALNKIEENAKFIETERRKVSFVLSDKKGIEAWEATILAKGTPLNTFCKQLKKINAHQEAKRITENDKLGEFKMPLLKKGEKRRNKPDDVEKMLDIGESDDSEDEDSLFRPAGEMKADDEKPLENGVNKTTLKKKNKKNKKKKTAGSDISNNNIDNEEDIDMGEEKEDVVVDFKFSDSE